MAKNTAIIDIGSNSVRMIIVEKSSRFAFRIQKEVHQRVRISEGSYQNNGFLQEMPMQRCIEVLRDFKSIAHTYKCRKILCVATSAVRDAKNKEHFIQMVRQLCKLNIKVIDGQKEAFFGGIAVANLSCQDTGFTLDIGGGSTEMCIFSNKNIKQKNSLDMGTVRLKELFFDQNVPLQNAQNFVRLTLEKSTFSPSSTNMVGLGGIARTLGKIWLKKNPKYPLQKIHNLQIKAKEITTICEKILEKTPEELMAFDIKEHRLDVAKPGALILKTVLEHFDIQTFTVSGTGVREGVFLTDLLRPTHCFPSNFNPSIKNLQDQFIQLPKINALVQKSSIQIFNCLEEAFKLSPQHRWHLQTACKLFNVAQKQEIAPILTNHLSYGLSHGTVLLLIFLIQNSSRCLPTASNIDTLDIKLQQTSFEPIKPIKLLCFILLIARKLTQNFDCESKPYIEFKDKTLHISTNSVLAFKDLQNLQEKYHKVLPIKVTWKSQE